MTRSTPHGRFAQALLTTAALAGAMLMMAPLGLASATPAAPIAATEKDPITVAVIVPLVVPDTAGAILTAEQLATWTAPTGILSERVNAVTNTEATLAIDPRIVASIRLLGDEAPESARAWLAQVEGLPHATFALGWADADVAGLRAINRSDLAVPRSLQFAVTPSRFDAPPPAPTPSASTSTSTSTSAIPDAPAPASPTPTPTTSTTTPAMPLPSDDELLAVPHTLDAVWSAPTGTTANALHLGETSFAVNTALSAAADLAAEPFGSAARQALLTQLVAHEEPTALIGLSRSVEDGATDLAALLALLANDERVEFVSLSDYVRRAEDDPTPTPDPDAPAAEDRRALLSRVAAGSDAEARVATVTPDPAAFLDRRRLDLLTALSLGRIATSPASEQAFLDASLDVRGAVRIAETSDLLVLSNTTGLPLTIVNGLDVAVTVMVDARPLRPLLRIDGVPREVTVEPGSSHTVYLPTQAVTNGRADVVAVLRNGAGERIGPERVIRVDLQAQWEAVGIAILVLLGVVFTAGIANNIVKRRRAARAAGTANDADE